LWVIFGLTVLAIYYQQIWKLFTVGPVRWIQDNSSLNALFSPAWHLIQGDHVEALLRYLPQAIQRGFIALYGAIIILTCAYFLGLAILKLLRIEPGDPVDGLLYRIGTGLGALSYLALGLAALSLYHRDILRMVVLAIFGAGIVYTVYQQRTKQQTLKQDFARISLSVRENKLWVLVFGFACAIALVGALAPEIEYDALWYHLWLPDQWLQNGSPVDIVREYISLYPLTWELNYGIAMTLGGPIAAKLLHFSMLLLTSLLVFQLTRFAAPKASPWIALALFVTLPTVLWQATTSYIDLALTFYVGMAIYTLMQYTRKNDFHYLALAIISLGLALAIKHLAIIVWLLVLCGLSVWLWLEKRNRRQITQAVLFLGGISLLFPLPWYLRSWIASGNPVFPDLYTLFGAFPAERWSQISEIGLNNFKEHFGFPRTPLNLALLPWNITIHGARFGGSFGPILLILLAAFFVFKPKGKELRWMGIFSLGYLVFWASPLSSFQLRFLLPVTPFLAVLSAAAFQEIASQFPGLGRKSNLLSWILIALLILNLPPFTSLHETDREGWNGWLTHVIHELPMGVVFGYESEGDFLARKVPSYRAWEYINTNLPLDAFVLTFSGGDHLYSDRTRISSDATAAHPAVWGAGSNMKEQALQALRDLGVTYVLFDRQQLESGALDSLALVQDSSLNSWYELEYDDERFLLARLRWEQLSQ